MLMETIQVHFFICNILPLSLLFSLIGKHSVSVPNNSSGQSVEGTQGTELGVGEFQLVLDDSDDVSVAIKRKTPVDVQASTKIHPTQDKKLSMVTKVILKKLPIRDCNALYYKVKENVSSSKRVRYHDVYSD